MPRAPLDQLHELQGADVEARDRGQILQLARNHTVYVFKNQQDLTDLTATTSVIEQGKHCKGRLRPRQDIPA